MIYFISSKQVKIKYTSRFTKSHFQTKIERSFEWWTVNSFFNSKQFLNANISILHIHTNTPIFWSSSWKILHFLILDFAKFLNYWCTIWMSVKFWSRNEIFINWGKYLCLSLTRKHEVELPITDKTTDTNIFILISYLTVFSYIGTVTYTCITPYSSDLTVIRTCGLCKYFGL